MIKILKWFFLITSVVFLLISCNGNEVALQKEPAISQTEQFVIEDLMNERIVTHRFS